MRCDVDRAGEGRSASGPRLGSIAIGDGRRDEAADLMETHKINCMLVIDETGALVGAFNSNDLMRAKVI